MIIRVNEAALWSISNKAIAAGRHKMREICFNPLRLLSLVATMPFLNSLQLRERLACSWCHKSRLYSLILVRCCSQRKSPYPGGVGGTFASA